MQGTHTLSIGSHVLIRLTRQLPDEANECLALLSRKPILTASAGGSGGMRKRRVVVIDSCVCVCAMPVGIG